MTEAEANPDPGQLADDQDELDWTVKTHGRMLVHATEPDDEPVTVPWEG